MLLLLSIYIFQSLEDLVNSLIKALERQRSRGPCTREDYENVMKGLRYQLVAMAMSYMCRQSTPRIEIQVSRARRLHGDTLFWPVKLEFYLSRMRCHSLTHLSPALV